MEDNDITERLRNQISFIGNVFGLELTLSEILSLRRYVIEEELSKSKGLSQSTSSMEPVARLLKDYYGIDFLDLFPRRDDGKPIIAIAGFSRLVKDQDDEYSLSKEFKEYLRDIQRNSYLP